MKGADAKKFVATMKREISDRESREHWTIVKRSSIPPLMKKIHAIWGIKSNRFPKGRLNKHKDWICAYSGMQE